MARRMNSSDVIPVPYSATSWRPVKAAFWNRQKKHGIICITVNWILGRAALALRALAAVLLYIAAHEGGHVLAGLATGGAVTQVTLVSLTPSVTLRGLSTPAEQALAAAAGSTVVVALWFAFMLLRPTKHETFNSNAFTLFAGIELLAWFVSAGTHQFAPQRNDVTKFIDASGLQPLLVAAVVGMIAVLAAVISSPSFNAAERVRRLSR
jgi:hypothetical protein